MDFGFRQLKEILRIILFTKPHVQPEFVPPKGKYEPDESVVIRSLINSISVPVVSVNSLHVRLGFTVPLDYPHASLVKSLIQWKMEVDDAPIFRYIYRFFYPRRHLEFGTWYGAGTMYCLEECAASVWTINLPFGENDPTGNPIYDYSYDYELADVRAWAKKIGMESQTNNYQTDSIGFIGKLYLEKEMGNRVCQIYCDSRQWDTTNYPPAFFDTVLIDGGHTEDIVTSDMFKALPLLRPGGVIMWHDFCPKIEVYEACPATRGVFKAIHSNWEWLNNQLQDIFWIEPSHILFGVKK